VFCILIRLEPITLVAIPFHDIGGGWDHFGFAILDFRLGTNNLFWITESRKDASRKDAKDAKFGENSNIFLCGPGGLA